MRIESQIASLDGGELRSRARLLRHRTAFGEPVSIRSDDVVGIALALSGLEGWSSELHLVPDALAPSGLEDVVLIKSDTIDEALLGDVPATEAIDPELALETSVVVYTSGTTGEPKPIRHTLSTLTRTISPSSRQSDLVWGLLYDPNRMAGLQVLLQAMSTGTRLVAPSLRAPLPERMSILIESGVTALSATPTLWRMILQSIGASEWPLEQITLGGEIADQRVLDALHRRFPEARIVHIFASTETGAAFSVVDGREGFPVSFLTEPPKGVKLAIRDDVLHVYSPGVSASGPDGFASTGDIVELVDDRVLFRGRLSGVVNIGGANVWPEEVETLLRSHPDVLEARVTSVPNSMAGNLLMAEVVAHPASDADGLGKRVRTWARGHVSGPQVPARVRVVESIEVASTGKAIR